MIPKIIKIYTIYILNIIIFYYFSIKHINESLNY